MRGEAVDRLELRMRRILLALGIKPETPLALAFSGGLDSVVLLNLLVRCGLRNIRAVHVCHNIRPADELAREKVLIKETCMKMHVNLTIVNVKEGAIDQYASKARCGIEAAARHFRYRALVRSAQRFGIRTVVTAHHADDQVETFLLGMVRGGSLRALSGIEPVRMLSASHGIYIVRPLLSFERVELLQYAMRKGIVWSEDSTNADTAFMRNKIRHVLIPLLNAEFPSWKTSVLSYVEQIREEHEFVERSAQKILHRLLAQVEGEELLDIELLKKERRLMRLAVIKLYLARLGGGIAASREAVEELDQAISSNKKRIEAGGFEFDLAEGFLKFCGKTRGSSAQAVRAISPLLDSYEKDQYFLMVPAAGTYRCGPYIIQISEYEHGSTLHDAPPPTANSLVCAFFPFILRNRRAGDTILGPAGQKAVDTYLKEIKIAARLRHEVPVIEDKDGIAAVIPSAFGNVASARPLLRDPALCQNKKMKYILLSMKGDSTINVRSKR